MLNTVDFTGGKRTFLTVRTIPALQPFPTAMARAKTPTLQREPISPGILACPKRPLLGPGLPPHPFLCSLPPSIAQNDLVLFVTDPPILLPQPLVWWDQRDEPPRLVRHPVIPTLYQTRPCTALRSCAYLTIVPISAARPGLVLPHFRETQRPAEISDLPKATLITSCRAAAET